MRPSSSHNRVTLSVLIWPSEQFESEITALENQTFLNEIPLNMADGGLEAKHALEIWIF